ncbi:hypothetical protein BKA70DRAFT_1257649 [Coprinopsis sp. MPI-PUGE-AT-0042]|nr:hypothetical protein BKA70DRAFT_1257649 [Coprinopsis sp. MPI-PUGE-AT-0042]
MLKLWKRTWRGTSEGSAPSPSPGPPDDDETAGRKRRREDDQDSESERPLKQGKSDPTESVPIQHILPEIEAGTGQISNVSELRAAVLEAAKRSNTIAYLPKLSNIDIVCYEFLRWAVGEMKAQIPAPQKLSLFIVEQETTLEAHALYIQTSSPDFSCFTCTTTSAIRGTDLANHDIVVTSSQNALELFSKGAVEMHQVHAIIIEDAQHIKSHDCYAYLPVVQLMNNFYSPCPMPLRPRVFALALSADLTRHPFDSRSLELEKTLHAHTYGIPQSKRNQIVGLPDRPNESVVLYDRADNHIPSQLFVKIQAIDPEFPCLRDATHIAAEIGNCASDLTFRGALQGLEKDLPAHSASSGSTQVQQRIQIRDLIRNWTFTMPNTNPSSDGFNVSHKLLRLIQTLEACSEYGEDFRGIIFVQRRATAVALVEMLKMLPDRLRFIRAVSVDGKMRTQSQIFSSFAAGAFNLMVITKSVPELGVPKASVVLRFDLVDSQLLYAQIRSCARGRESLLIHLVERHNDSHRRMLNDSTFGSEAMLAWMDSLRDSDSITVPPDDLKESSYSYMSDEEGDTATTSNLCITETTIGGRIYPQDAVATLLKYACSLRSNAETRSNHSLFEIKATIAKAGRALAYTSTIRLPGSSIDGVAGSPEASKPLSRRSAAFAACKRLLKLGELDYRIVPLPSSDRPGPALVSTKEDTGRMYRYKTPHFWSTANTGSVSVLYPTIIRVSGMEVPYAPLLIFTRQPLTKLPPFDLFVSRRRATVEMFPGASFSVDAAQVEALHGFTLRMMKICLNKDVVCSLEDMTYFLGAGTKSWQARMAGSHTVGSGSDVEVNWELIKIAAEKYAVPISNSAERTMDEDLEDAVIQDRWTEFTRRFFSIRVRHDMSPLSKPKESDREAGYDTLLAYVTERRHNFTGLKDEHQPIIEVEKIPSLLNHLNPRLKEAEAVENSAKYLIPELCAKVTVPASLLRTQLLLPSILTKIDDLLVVKELNSRMFNNLVREDLLYHAVTTVSAEMEYNYERLELLGDAFLKYMASIVVFVANPSQNEGSLHIARQTLISNRALLACAISVDLPSYIRSRLFNMKFWKPWPAATYVPAKAKVPVGASVDAAEEAEAAALILPVQGVPLGTVDGRSGVQQDTDAGGPSAMEVDAPVPNPASDTPAGEPKHNTPQQEASPITPAKGGQGTEEDPEAPKGNKKKKKKKGKKRQTDEVGLQPLGDKAIADVAEAILGAAYISGGREGGLRAAKALALPVADINTWSDFGTKVVITFNTDMTEALPGAIEGVEGIVGHKFRQTHLLAQVLTHTAMKGHKALEYERLEFIGDAILDFLVIRHIYTRERNLSPGGLTNLKGAMVSNSTLGAICVLSGISQYLLFSSHGLSESIKEYETKIKARALEEQALALKEKRPPGQFWTDTEPPKALSDVVEAIVGALYISDGFSPAGAETFFDKVLRPFFNAHITLETLAHHPAKTLFEFVQGHGCQQIQLRKGSKKKGGLMTCDVLIHDAVFATASDTSISIAARRACASALGKFGEGGNVLANLCDCSPRSGQSKGSLSNKTFEQALSSLEQESGG